MDLARTNQTTNSITKGDTVRLSGTPIFELARWAAHGPAQALGADVIATADLSWDGKAGT
jgi:hypothetical protein